MKIRLLETSFIYWIIYAGVVSSYSYMINAVNWIIALISGVNYGGSVTPGTFVWFFLVVLMPILYVITLILVVLGRVAKKNTVNVTREKGHIRS